MLLCMLAVKHTGSSTCGILRPMLCRPAWINGSRPTKKNPWWPMAVRPKTPSASWIIFKAHMNTKTSRSGTPTVDAEMLPAPAARRHACMTAHCVITHGQDQSKQAQPALQSIHHCQSHCVCLCTHVQCLQSCMDRTKSKRRHGLPTVPLQSVQCTAFVSVGALHGVLLRIDKCNHSRHSVPSTPLQQIHHCQCTHATHYYFSATRATQPKDRPAARAWCVHVYVRLQVLPHSDPTHAAK